MIRSSICSAVCSLLVGVVSAAAPAAYAQCSTCPTPTVAYYQPTVAQPTVVYQPVATQQVRTGWYPGRMFDRMRLRRWGVSTAVQPTYAAGYAPYTAAYAPQTAAYTPYTAAYAYAPTSYTAAYRPYVTSYAPLARTTYYYPATQTVARRVVMSPVVSACNTCVTPCSTCSSCDTGVSQAVYGAPSSGCSTCATGTSAPTYSSGPTAGPATPQPQLAPSEGAPFESQYQETKKATTDPSPESDSSTYFEAPKLFNPQDRTASRSSVDVHNAAYRQPATNHTASHASASETDANGWYAVPADR